MGMTLSPGRSDRGKMQFSNQDRSDTLTVDGSLKVGTGSTVKGVLTGTKTVDPAEFTYDGEEIAVTVTGAAAGDLAFVPTLTAGSLPDSTALVVKSVAANTVTLELIYTGNTAVDVGSITVQCAVLDIT